MKRRFLPGMLTVLLAALLGPGCKSGSGSSHHSSAPQAAPPPTIRVGAASSPKYGAVFDAMKRDFERQGQPFEFTLYMDYYKLVDALLKHEVDIAWNTPMAHARAILLTGGKVQGPIARDVDIQYAAQIVVRKDSGIDTIQDLVGKRVALGTVESAELQALPKHFLKLEGLDLDTQAIIINLDGLVDDQMNALSTATNVLNAVQNGDAEAGAVGEKTTRALRADPNSPLKVIWTSPRYTHCIMTALDDCNPEIIAAFKKVLLSETMSDPIGKEVLVNEGNDAVWLDSSSDRDTFRGFDELIASIHELNVPITEAAPAPGIPKIRVGGLSSTRALQTFDAMRRYFQREGGTWFEFVLYGTSQQLSDGLFNRRVDIAWNTPLDHARAFLRSDEKVIAPVSRDTDMHYHFQVVVRKGSGISSLKDLAGRRLVLGSDESAELSVLPRYYLPKAGLSLRKVTIVSLSGRTDAERKPTDGESFVAAAVANGEGDGGVVGDSLAMTISADPTSPLTVIWESPEFGYQTMTALEDYDQTSLNRFNEVMLSIKPADPTGKVVLDSPIGASAFVAGSNAAYVDVIKAADKQKVSVR